MNIEKKLNERSNGKCEFCGSNEHLDIFQVPPATELKLEESILVCSTCKDQVENPEKMDSNHWRCLNDSMWNENTVVQIMSWRMLNRIKNEGWPQDLLDMMYLDEETLEWAKATGEDEDESEKIIHKDCNGVVLQNGDSVVLTKDLPVKGSSLVAKRGAAVRNISLVWDNAEQLEGKVDGQHVVILTKFVKKTK